MLGRPTTTTSHWTNPDDPEDVRERTRTTEFDDEGRITRVLYAQGQEELTTYTASGQIASTTDQLGHETTFLYDARGRLIQTTFWDGTVSRTVYDAKGRAVYVTDAYLTSETPQGTHTLYDGVDRVVGTEQLETLVIDLVNTAGVWSTVLVSAGTVLSSNSSEYDAAGRLIASTDTYGLETRYTYDQFGRTVETRREAIDENEATVWIVNRTVYDQFGRVVLATDSYIEGSSDPISGTRPEYDQYGRAVKSFRLEGVEVEIVDAITGDPVDTLTDPDAIVVSRIADNGAILYFSETVYDQYGRVARTISGATDTPSPLGGEGWGEGLGWGANAQITDYEYDTLGRQTAVIGHGILASEAASPPRREPWCVCVPRPFTTSMARSRPPARTSASSSPRTAR